MEQTSTRLGWLLLVLSLALGTAHAQYLSFPVDGPLTANGFNTHSGTTGILRTDTNRADRGASLWYPGYALPSGYRARFVHAAGSESVNYIFPQPFLPAVNTVYASFLLKVRDTVGLAANNVAGTAYFANFSRDTGSAIGSTALISRVQIRKGRAGNTFQLGILNVTGGAAASNVDSIFSSNPVDLEVDTTHLIVLFFSFDGKVTRLWIDPVLGPSAPRPYHSNGSGTSSVPAQIGAFVLRQVVGGGVIRSTGNIDVDEIRFGTNWSDATAWPLGLSQRLAFTAAWKLAQGPDFAKVMGPEEAQVGRLELLSSTGQVVRQRTGTSTMSLDGLAAGLYLLRLTETTQGAVRTFPVVKN